MESKFQKIKMKDIPETHDSAGILNSNFKNICEAIYQRDNYFIGGLEKIDKKIDNLTTQLNDFSKFSRSEFSSLNKKVDAIENTMSDVKSALRTILDHLGLDKEEKVLKG